MSKTNIEWADETWNPTAGCSRVSEGCRNCYAERMAQRLAAAADAAVTKGKPRSPRMYAYTQVVKYRDGKPLRKWNGRVECIEESLTEPMKWREPRRVFVNSMSDLFHPDVPVEFITLVLATMILCPQHDFMVLTKRPERMAELMGKASVKEKALNIAYSIYKDLDLGMKWDDVLACVEHWRFTNIMFGTSAEDQATLEERVPHLLACPGRRFLSLEPLLGPIALSPYDVYASANMKPTGRFRTHNGKRQFELLVKRGAKPLINWVIVGGETGPGARPCNPDWVRSLRDQCNNAGVPFFFKKFADGSREIDGRTWEQMPIRERAVEVER